MPSCSLALFEFKEIIMGNYTELKSGSDVRGFASDIFENEINLTDDAVFDITAAFALFLEKKRQRRSPQRQFTQTAL